MFSMQRVLCCCILYWAIAGLIEGAYLHRDALANDEQLDRLHAMWESQDARYLYFNGSYLESMLADTVDGSIRHALVRYQDVLSPEGLLEELLPRGLLQQMCLGIAGKPSWPMEYQSRTEVWARYHRVGFLCDLRGQMKPVEEAILGLSKLNFKLLDHSETKESFCEYMIEAVRDSQQDVAKLPASTPILNELVAELKEGLSNLLPSASSCLTNSPLLQGECPNGACPDSSQLERICSHQALMMTSVVWCSLQMGRFMRASAENFLLRLGSHIMGFDHHRQATWHTSLQLVDHRLRLAYLIRDLIVQRFHGSAGPAILRILEIGIMHGDTMDFLLKTYQVLPDVNVELKFIGVDPFITETPAGEVYDFVPSSVGKVAGRLTRHAQRCSEPLFADPDVGGRGSSKLCWALLPMDSASAADLIPDASLDLVFVDGDHSFAGALEDIQKYMPKLKPGGIMSGHDCCNAISLVSFPGIERALRHVFGNSMTELHFGQDSTWWVKLPEGS